MKLNVGKLAKFNSEVALTVGKTIEEADNNLQIGGLVPSISFKKGTVVEVVEIFSADRGLVLWFPVERVFACFCSSNRLVDVND